MIFQEEMFCQKNPCVIRQLHLKHIFDNNRNINITTTAERVQSKHAEILKMLRMISSFLFLFQ